MKNKSNLSRREFINRSALGVAAVALSPFNSVIASSVVNEWGVNASKYNFTMIGHGHIDPVWLWRWTEGISVVHSTFRSALDRMKEDPDMKFTCSSAQFYEWVEENDPEMLKEVRQRIKEGRWEVIGGWWVEPDVNIPSGEAMVRQGLYGQLTLERTVGKRATVATNPDSFGHAGTLPQIISKQGMNSYTFMRPGPHEKDIPSDLFWWEAPDGSKVLTYRIQDSYNDGADISRRLNSIMKKAPTQPMNHFLAYYGVGDHGGGPTKANIKSINEIRKDKSAPVVNYGRVDQYFDWARKSNLDLPTIKDDLQHHAVGCYTADWAIKKGNRLSEEALVTAEKICAMGVNWGAKYPKQKFTDSWKKLLFLQFHDSMAGSSLASHTQDAVEGYGHIQDQAHEAAAIAIQKLEWQIPSEDPESEYLVVFNSNAWEVTTNIKYDLGWFGDMTATIVTDDRGKELQHQWVLGESQCGNRRGLVVTVTIPPMGYRQIRIKKGTPEKLANPIKVDERYIENEYYKLRINYDGTVTIFDKELGIDIFGGNKGCRAIIIDDKSDAWSHDIQKFDQEIGQFKKAYCKVLEEGPMRGVVRVISYWGDSNLQIDWSLTAGSREIGAECRLDWHEQLKMLKFSFPVDLANYKSTYEVPYGIINKKEDGWENPGQRWIDLSGSKNGKSFGLTVFNDAKYGYDFTENDMRITIARSAVYAHHNPKKLDLTNEYYWMDQGIQTFRMMLLPHMGDWKNANSPHKAEEFLSRPLVVYQGIHPGKLAKSASYLRVDVDNIIVTSIKHSEKGKDLIFRCVETLGKSGAACLQFANGKSWMGNFKPFEIKTLRCNLERDRFDEVNLLEE